MRRRIILLLSGLVLGMIAAHFLRRTPVADNPAPSPPTVAIEDGKTIDFSGGQAEVRDNPEDRAAIERALKEMEEAAKDVTFGPTKPPPPPP